MTRLRLAFLVVACLAVVLAPVPNRAQNAFCFDYSSAGECAENASCQWCPGYGVCLNRTSQPPAACNCANSTTLAACEAVPLCTYCADLGVCRHSEDDPPCNCGNHVLDEGEECDGIAYCDNAICRCETGFTPDSGNCVPLCGDGVMLGGENCEFVNGLPTAHCSPQTCRCDSGYIPDPAHPGQCFASNHAPVLGSIGNRQVNEGALLEFTIAATDPDPGQALIATAGDLPTGAAFDPVAGVFSWTPGYGQAGNYVVIFTVTDDGSPAMSDYEQVTITVGNVNRPPALAEIPPQQVSEGATLSFVVSAADPDGDILTYSASGGVGSAFPAGAAFDASTRTFTWTPDYGQSGNYVVLFTVTDSGAPQASAQAAVTITVGDVNRPPVLAPIGGRSVAEGGTLWIVVSATDPDGSVLTFSVDALPAGATFDAATRTFGWTPGYSQAGLYYVTFTVADGGMPSLSVSERVAITVGNVNRPPLLNAIGGRTVIENQTLSFTVAGSDPDSDVLAYSATGLPNGASFDPYSRTFTWTPASGQAGSYPVRFTVTDTGALTASEAVTVTVSPAVAAARIGIDPNTLNVKSNGGASSFTVYIELDSSANLMQIAVSSITLTVNGLSVPSQLAPAAIGDHDGNGKPDLMVKFDRQAIIRALGTATGQTAATVRGTLAGGRAFVGSGTFTVIR